MCVNYCRSAFVVLAFLVGMSAVQARAQQATVVLSQNCEYLLLNANSGMVLVKQLGGQPPRTGDTLQGPLHAGDFSKLQNTRNKQSMKVWVDLVDPHNSKALSQYGRYCT